MGTESQESEATDHDAQKKKESVPLLTSLWDACESWFKVIMTAATHKRRLWRTTKAAATSTTFPLVSILMLYYFMAGLPWLHGQGGFQEDERFVQGSCLFM